MRPERPSGIVELRDQLRKELKPHEQYNTGYEIPPVSAHLRPEVRSKPGQPGVQQEPVIHLLLARRRCSKFSVNARSGANKGFPEPVTANAATAPAAWPWQVAGKMLKWGPTAVFKIFCKCAKCDAQRISRARGLSLRATANAATAPAAWPWRVAGKMLKWRTDERPMKVLIPVTVGAISIAFSRRSVKAGGRTGAQPPAPDGQSPLNLPGYIMASSA